MTGPAEVCPDCNLGWFDIKTHGDVVIRRFCGRCGKQPFDFLTNQPLCEGTTARVPIETISGAATMLLLLANERPEGPVRTKATALADALKEAFVVKAKIVLDLDIELPDDADPENVGAYLEEWYGGGVHQAEDEFGVIDYEVTAVNVQVYSEGELS